MFPDNFVQLREPQKVPPPADPAPQIRGERERGEGREREGRGREGEGGIDGKKFATKLLINAITYSYLVSISAMPQSSKTRRAKVAFSYAADNIDELSLEPGQIVEVLAEEEEGWWRGKMGVKEGVFPSNFVEIIEEAAEPPKAAAPAASSQSPPTQQSAPPHRPPSPGESEFIGQMFTFQLASGSLLSTTVCIPESK